MLTGLDPAVPSLRKVVRLIVFAAPTAPTSDRLRWRRCPAHSRVDVAAARRPRPAPPTPRRAATLARPNHPGRGRSTWFSVCTVFATMNPASAVAKASAQISASSSVTPRPNWNAPTSCRKCRCGPNRPHRRTRSGRPDTRSRSRRWSPPPALSPRPDIPAPRHSSDSSCSPSVKLVLLPESLDGLGHRTWYVASGCGSVYQCCEGVGYGSWLLDPGEVARFGDDVPDRVRSVESLVLPQRLRHDAVR